MGNYYNSNVVEKNLFHLGLVTFDKNKSTGVFIKTDKYTEIRWQWERKINDRMIVPLHSHSSR